MPIIKPSTELRNNYNEISELCHSQSEPVFITKNGTGDLAVMSIEMFDLLTKKDDFYRAVELGFKDFKAGRVIPLKESRKRIERLLDA